MEMIEIVITCPICGAEHSVSVDYGDFLAWQAGELAQNAFPYLSATEREALISGMCPQCQLSLFGEDEEEDEDFDLEMGFDPYVGGYTYDC